MIYRVIKGCSECPFAKKGARPLFGFEIGPECKLGGFDIKAPYNGRGYVGGWFKNPGYKVYTNLPEFLQSEIPSAPIDNRCPLKKEVCLVKLADHLE